MKTYDKIRPNSFAAWVICSRPKTWGIAIAPVAVGLGMALVQTHTINTAVAAATLLLSILMQVISNMENDAGYTKRKAERGNRKGLPRATANGWLSVDSVEKAIKLLAGVVLLDTFYLIYCGGWIMLFISLSSVLAAYCYMGGPRPIAYSPYGEGIVFIFFGLVAVCGTYYLQTGSISLETILAACSLGLIAAAVLAVNNYRDLEHDASVGRQTLAVVIGEQGMVTTYKALLFVPFLLITIMIGINPQLWPSALVFLSMNSALQLMEDFPQRKAFELNAVMFGTVKLELIFSWLLVVSTVVSWSWQKAIT